MVYLEILFELGWHLKRGLLVVLYSRCNLGNVSGFYKPIYRQLGCCLSNLNSLHWLLSCCQSEAHCLHSPICWAVCYPRPVLSFPFRWTNVRSNPITSTTQSAGRGHWAGHIITPVCYYRINCHEALVYRIWFWILVLGQPNIVTRCFVNKLDCSSLIPKFINTITKGLIWMWTILKHVLLIFIYQGIILFMKYDILTNKYFPGFQILNSPTLFTMCVS